MHTCIHAHKHKYNLKTYDQKDRKKAETYNVFLRTDSKNK